MYDPAQLKKDAETIRKSGYFDADWYRATYPDVDRLGMDPAEHYLKYGASLRRDPGPEFCTGFYLDSHPGGWQKTTNPLVRFQGKGGGEMAPEERSILWAAQNVARRGEHARAIALAERYLPEDLAYTAHILRANAAIARGREDDWLAHLNAYLGQFDVAPLVLEGTGALLDRFATAPLPPVTGGPLVSVIMPAFNAEGTIRAAARSILNQTWRNLELLIVDDASEDGTWAVMQEIAAGDSRVRIHRNKVNVGPYVSKNLALMEAKGEWITGHDADDWAHPQRLEQHLGEVLANESKLFASLTHMIRMSPHGTFSRLKKVSEYYFDGATCKASISCLYAKEPLSQLGGWDCVRFGADTEMIYRFSQLTRTESVPLRQLGMICLDSPSNLTNHPEWGVTERGVSGARLKYKTAWQAWHASVRSSKDLYLPFPHQPRKFECAPEIIVPSKSIMMNAKSAEPRLSRVIFILSDISVVGGIANRISNTLQHAKQEQIKYYAISRKHSSEVALENAYSATEQPGEVHKLLDQSNSADTVVFLSNNTLLAFPRDIKSKIQSLPIVYIAAGQMAFMIQDSSVLKDYDYIKELRASRIISFSDADINFQRQLGIHGQVKGFVPIPTRSENLYQLNKPRRVGYVGRIDFHTKDCEKLINIAHQLKMRGQPPIRIFTTDAKNSPDYNRFLELARQANVEDHLDITLNVRDKERIYSNLSWLVVPSKKESFGNAILEAFSFGVPVIGASYAPGPSELIRHGESGYLLDTFSGKDVVDCILQPSDRELIEMSNLAFDRHKDFSMERYYEFTESVAMDVLREFDGENKLQVMPTLKVLHGGALK